MLTAWFERRKQAAGSRQADALLALLRLSVSLVSTGRKMDWEDFWLQ